MAQIDTIDTAQYLKEALGSICQDAEKLIERVKQLINDIDSCLLNQSEVHVKKLRGRRGRPTKNDRSLHDYVMEVLENSNEPLTSKEIADLVLEKGYITEAKTAFSNIVLHALTVSSDFRKATRGKRRPIRYSLNK